MPALVPLTIFGGFPEAASGVRCPAKVTLFLDEKPILSDQGELQWTSYGISGIVVFQLSHYAARGLAEGKKAVVELDLLPDESPEELKQMAASLMPELLLNGLFAKKIAACPGKGMFWEKAAGAMGRILTDTAIRVCKAPEALCPWDERLCAGAGLLRRSLRRRGAVRRL